MGDKKKFAIIVIVIVAIFSVVAALLLLSTQSNRERIRKAEQKAAAMKYNNAGIKYMQENDTDNAIKQFLMAIKVDQNFYSAYVNLGNIYLKKKDFENAFSYFNTSISLNPSRWEAYQNRAAAYSERDMHDEAIADTSHEGHHLANGAQGLLLNAADASNGEGKIVVDGPKREVLSRALLFSPQINRLECHNQANS